MLAASVGTAGAGGCRRDVRLADESIRHVTVRPVTHYGVTLDEQASPEQTAYVLLHAIKDDFLAPDKARREAALDIQFDICAANIIQGRNASSLERDEFIHHAVGQWTPTVSHYVHDFETEWEKAQARFLRIGPQPAKTSKTGVAQCQVLLEVGDPSGDPGARVVLAVSLARDNGLWRTTRLGFARASRSVQRWSAGAAHPAGGATSSND